jgi:hypothetical protein
MVPSPPRRVARIGGTPADEARAQNRPSGAAAIPRPALDF